MKKEIITAIACITLGCSASAQVTRTTAPANPNAFEQYFTFGPRVGINAYNVSGFSGSDSKTGLMAGAFMVYSFQEHFGISADLLYSAQGAKFTDERSITEGGVTSVTRTKNNLALNYLQMPVQANVFFGQFGNRLRPKVTLGPSIGLLLAARDKASDIKMKNDFKAVDLGAVVGAGLNYRVVESVWLNFDVRYFIGATDINDNNTTLGNKELKNMGLSASMGLGIGL